MNAQVESIEQPKEGELLPLAEAQPKSAIVEYTQTEAALADLRGRLRNVVFDVKTTAGDKAARAARKELVTLRTSLDAKRLELNAKDQERIDGRNAEAKRITTEIKALEEPLDKQLKAEEQRKADEKKAREEAEAKRVAAIQERIDWIRQQPVEAVGESAADIEQRIQTMIALPIDGTFAELEKQAEGARATSLIRLRAALTKAQALETEQKRLAQERAENERIRLENEAKVAAERARIAEEERVAREGREAEMARQRAATELHASRMSEIHGIQQQVIIAQIGRLGVRQGGTIECIRETLAETEKWPIEEASFGPMIGVAQAAKDRALTAIRELLIAAEAKAAQEAQAAAERQRLADENAAIQARVKEQEAREQRIADAQVQLERDQAALKAEREKPAPQDAPTATVLTFSEPTVSVPVSITESLQPMPDALASDGLLIAESSEPLIASINFKEWLAMDTVCKAAKEWAAFQHPDSKAAQKMDRKLAARAREAVNNLLIAVEQLL